MLGSDARFGIGSGSVRYDQFGMLGSVCSVQMLGSGCSVRMLGLDAQFGCSVRMLSSDARFGCSVRMLGSGSVQDAQFGIGSGSVRDRFGIGSVPPRLSPPRDVTAA
ncbi:hypothetical protein TURU_069346 [Turdus rufiventris]|nr:hypothetical protein TURU_069346 [Turdus rufiventris]